MDGSGEQTASDVGHIDDSEDIGSNDSANPTITGILAERLSRRELMQGLAAVAVAGGAEAGEAKAQAVNTTPSFNFTEVVVGSDDRSHVAEGYDADVLIRWGDPMFSDAPAFDPTRQTVAAQARQFGYNNDFLGFIPLGGSSVHGLVVVNHEYANKELMFADIGGGTPSRAAFAKMTRELAEVELMAHGGSVLEVRRSGGKWAVVVDSRYNRRITAETEMAIAGPAAGHSLLRTKADPTGTRVRGMLNNCAGGVTPWGTWLTCEENFNSYFWDRKAAQESANAVALRRYGVPVEWYNWGQYFERFDLAREPNECNRFGWVVEIDPLDPTSMPVKRTALGRFKHEGAGNVISTQGHFVVYSGDDERFEYIYKFVSDGLVNLSNRAANHSLLDRGTLYVARFGADGTGEWLPLVHGRGPLTAANGFADQATVLIHARLAADALGATKMDRPEDIDVSPITGKAYVMLTRNESRRPEQVDAANPRPANLLGHIIEITPSDGDHAAISFRWEILVRCGNPRDARSLATFNPATSSNGWFGLPDNGLVDAAGRLWVATDGNNAGTTGRTDGLWALETEGAARGTGKLFFRAPVGAEVCGPMMTPDMTTLFVAVQHPGEGSNFSSPSTRWPDFRDGVPPRPAVVAITRRGGGRIA